MKSFKQFVLLFICITLFYSCSEDNNPITPDPVERTIEIILNDIPYPTEKFLRIGYTLKMWEYEKEGLELTKIDILNSDNGTTIMTLDKVEMLVIYKDPLPVLPHFTWDKLYYYYLSIQIRIPLDELPPTNVTHKLEFYDTLNDKNISVEGGSFSPRLSETPIAIASPVKGNNWLFVSQSSMGYHFYVLLFCNDKVQSGERYAFDNLRLNDDLSEYMNGDPSINESYYNYKDTLYAVADGLIVALQDNLPENNGNAQNIPINSLNEYAGNYAVLKIDDSHFAEYAHCVPNSFFVEVGDMVNEGDPIALIGNSGNSTAPHLHFQITDTDDVFFSNGLPFVLKRYKRINEFDSDLNLLNPPQQYFENAMMEEYTVIGFD